jgi:predicted TIM-barrel fold metal-dependent hydrolase
VTGPLEEEGALAPASPTRPGDVIDAHAHLFSLPLMVEYVESNPEESERFRKAVEERRFGRRGGGELPDLGADEMARWYVERIHAAGVAKAVVMSVFPDSAYMRDVISAAKGHVHALAYVDPRGPDAPEVLEREMAAGFRGVKLLPVNRRYRLSEPECRPFFERAAQLGAPIVVHYGVTVDPAGDLRYADPLDLSPVARDFPETTFVIAHFGAGFFGEVLRLAYQCANVCVDSSGTNNWIDYDPHGFTLRQVFERALLALGPERVLFGTDSGTTAPYRTWIKFQQMSVLDAIGLSEKDRDLVVRANAVRIFGLEPGGTAGRDGD